MGFERTQFWNKTLAWRLRQTRISIYSCLKFKIWLKYGLVSSFSNPSNDEMPAFKFYCSILFFKKSTSDICTSDFLFFGQPIYNNNLFHKKKLWYANAYVIFIYSSYCILTSINEFWWPFSFPILYRNCIVYVFRSVLLFGWTLKNP